MKSEISSYSEGVQQKLASVKEKWTSGDNTYGNIFAVYSLFMLYFYLTWIGSGTYIPYETIWKLVEPFHQFVELNWGVELIKVWWGGSGKQFFLFPLLAFIGTSPKAMMVLQTTGFALIGPLVYFKLKEKFDFYTGYSIALIFITFRLFQKWRTSDMYIFFLFVFTFFYFYIRWEKSGKEIYLLPMAFIAGFSPYVINISIYPIIAILLSTAIFKREMFYRVYRGTYFKAGLLFLLGASPILIYSWTQGFVNLNPEITLRQFPGIWNALVTRYNQFYLLTTPSGPINSYFQGRFHIYTLLFATGAVISIVKRRDLVYLGGFLIVFLMSIFTPHGTLPLHQLMVIYPFFLVIIAQNLVELKNIGNMHQAGVLIAVIIILLTWGSMTEHDIHPASLTLDEYEEFERMNKSDTIVTNHRHAFSMAMFDRNLSQKILATDDWKFRFQVSEQDNITVEEALKGYRNLSYTLMLIDEGPCEKTSYNAERCGYSTSTIMEKGGLNRKNADIFRAPRERRIYLVFN